MSQNAAARTLTPSQTGKATCCVEAVSISPGGAASGQNLREKQGIDAAGTDCSPRKPKLVIPRGHRAYGRESIGTEGTVISRSHARGNCTCARTVHWGRERLGGRAVLIPIDLGCKGVRSESECAGGERLRGTAGPAGLGIGSGDTCISHPCHQEPPATPLFWTGHCGR